jgi:hypothetical protein
MKGLKLTTCAFMNLLFSAFAVFIFIFKTRKGMF